MVMDMLVVPFKRTHKLDLVHILGTLVEASSIQTRETFQKDLEWVDNLRDKVANPEISESNLIDHLQYHELLTLLMDKFPNDQISFTWMQTLSGSSIIAKQNSLQWEQQNVLFNIAAMYSLLAVDIINDLPLQCKYFQMCAIILKYLVDNFTAHYTIEQNKNLNFDPPPIMDNYSIKSLQFLILAQAMECIWKKTVLDNNMKNKTISKISSQIVQYYQDSIDFAVKSLLIRNDWINHLKNKHLYFQAVTIYRMSIDLHSKELFGQEIAFLRNVLIILKKCQLDTKNFQETVLEKLNDLERDNDYIFHQLIPNDEPILVKPMNMINLDLPMYETIFGKLVKSELANLFDKLLPLEVIEASTVFKERENKYIHERIVLPLTALNKLLNEKLIDYTSKNLSTLQISSLHSIKEDEFLKYKLSINDLVTNSENVKAQLNKLNDMLLEEQSNDNELRLKHGSLNWTLNKSSEVNKPYVDKLNILFTYLTKGNEIDQNTMEIYGNIDQKLITSDVELPSSNNPIIMKIQNIIKQRDVFINHIEKKNLTQSILPDLITNYRNDGNINNFEKIYLNHIEETYKESLSYLEDEKEKNQDLIDRVSKQLEKDGTNIPAVNKRLDPRDLYIEDFKYSLSLLETVKTNIVDASKFYEDLINSLNNFTQEVTNFIESRNNEKRILNDKLIGQ